MAAAPSSFDLQWCTPDGLTVPIEPTDLRVHVAAEVDIEVKVEARGAARLAVALTITGGGRAGAGESGARFVFIPLDAASFLVAVAEPSDDPVVLVPVPSAPTWTLAAHPMPGIDGWLSASRQEGVAIQLRIVPGPADMPMCALRVSAMPPASARFRNDRGAAPTGAVRFSVPRLSPQLVTLECEWEFLGSGASPTWP